MESSKQLISEVLEWTTIPKPEIKSKDSDT